MNRDDCKDIEALILDAQRIIGAFRGVIKDYPLQLYTSGLAFSPKKSLVRKLHEVHTPKIADVGGEVDDDWTLGMPAFQADEEIFELAISHTTQDLVATDQGGNVYLWNIIDMTLRQLEPPKERFAALCLSKDLSLLATVSIEGDVRIWDIIENRLKWRQTAGSKPIGKESLAFSSGNQHLAVLLEEGVGFWDVATGTLRCICHKTWDTAETSMIMFSADCQLLIVMPSNPQRIPLVEVRMIDVVTGREQRHIRFEEPNVVVTAAFFSGEHLVLICQDGKLIFWNFRLQRQETRCTLANFTRG